MTGGVREPGSGNAQTWTASTPVPSVDPGSSAQPATTSPTRTVPPLGGTSILINALGATTTVTTRGGVNAGINALCGNTTRSYLPLGSPRTVSAKPEFANRVPNMAPTSGRAIPYCAA